MPAPIVTESLPMPNEDTYPMTLRGVLAYMMDSFITAEKRYLLATDGMDRTKFRAEAIGIMHGLKIFPPNIRKVFHEVAHTEIAAWERAGMNPERVRTYSPARALLFLSLLED